jgi:flagellar basal-body rod modification protein FlgD
MTVSAVEATPGILGATSSTSTSATGAASKADKDMFLQLLVAQMRYQDPSNPTDTSQFLSQTAQFTSLEKMQEVADQTSQLVSLQVAFGATAMVGKSVAYVGTDGSAATGVVSSVRFEATGPVLQVDGRDVPMAAVQSLGDGTTELPLPVAGATGDTGNTPTA